MTITDTRTKEPDAARSMRPHAVRFSSGDRPACGAGWPVGWASRGSGGSTSGLAPGCCRGARRGHAGDGRAHRHGWHVPAVGHHRAAHLPWLGRRVPGRRAAAARRGRGGAPARCRGSPTRGRGAVVLGWFLGVVMVAPAAGGPGGGEADAVDAFLVSFIVLLAALAVGAACVAGTVITERARHGSHGRAAIQLRLPRERRRAALTLPVLAGTVALLFVDHHYARIVFGGNEGIIGEIGWSSSPRRTCTPSPPWASGRAVPGGAGRRQPTRAVVIGALGLAGAAVIGGRCRACRRWTSTGSRPSRGWVSSCSTASRRCCPSCRS